MHIYGLRHKAPCGDGRVFKEDEDILSPMTDLESPRSLASICRHQLNDNAASEPMQSGAVTREVSKKKIGHRKRRRGECRSQGGRKHGRGAGAKKESALTDGRQNAGSVRDRVADRMSGKT